MRDLLERSRPARVAVAVVAGCCVLALAQAAAAHNDLDMREVFRVPAPVPAPAAASQAAAPTSVSRRQPAARPLRVALARPQRRDRHEAGRKAAPAPAPRRSATMTAARGSPALHVAALPPSRDELFEPVPQKPAIVSIYADQTLRRGDAVVMGNGLRIFGGRETGLHQPADFVPLTRAPSLEWHLRRTLSAFDNNPPDRWPS